MDPDRKTVAVVGASTDRSKFGNKAVRAYLDRGWKVYPINPHAQSVEGVKAYASLDELSGPIDRVTLYLPPEAGIRVLPSIARLRPREFFVNPGAESEDLLQAADTLGLSPIMACSIVEIGASPAAFPA